MNKYRILWIFLGFWFLMNLVQAGFTGLFNDEAYYYYYSTHLAWGYYDHPPLIAVFTSIGYSFFSNELGVRIIYVLLSIGTIFIIYKLSEIKNELIFCLLVFSFMIFQLTGFLAIPDSLLLFFTALFFLVYKRYSETYSVRDALLLGLVMAGLFYSKYLGILVIFFTVLSNYRLLLKRSFWLAVLTTTLLFIPHILWQYRHDFPSFYYHLVERSHDEYFRWSNFGDFIAGQFGQTNPFLFIPLVYFLIIFKPASHYEKALKTVAAGSLLLPILLMVKGRVEANWTMAGLVPLFILAGKMFENRPKFHRYLYFTGGITLVLVLTARILLALNMLPENYSGMINKDGRGWKPVMDKISKLADSRPVVFIGSYQNPSRYIFNTGKEAFAFNDRTYRNNQYDLEDVEERIQGSEVLLVFPEKSVDLNDLAEYGIELTDSIQYPNGTYRYYVYEKNYHTYNFIRADIILGDNEMKAGTMINLPIIIKNPGQEVVNFGETAPGQVYLTYSIFEKGKIVVYEKFEDISSLILKDEYKTTCMMRIPAKPGVYFLRISIKNSWLPAGINSRLHKIRVN